MFSRILHSRASICPRCFSVFIKTPPKAWVDSGKIQTVTVTLKTNVKVVSSGMPTKLMLLFVTRWTVICYFPFLCFTLSLYSVKLQLQNKCVQLHALPVIYTTNKGVSVLYQVCLHSFPPLITALGQSHCGWLLLFHDWTIFKTRTTSYDMLAIVLNKMFRRHFK